jgi:hypothetical protein
MIHTITPLPNIGILNAKFSNAELKPVIDEINDIRMKNFSGTKMNSSLAGNIEHEFELFECVSHVNHLLMPLLKTYDKQFRIIDEVAGGVFHKPTPVCLDRLWVNFQKKHDFNPTHRHGGVISFVIWIDVPYDIDIEKQHPTSKDSSANFPGHFQFVYTNVLGEISTYNIPADLKFKNQMVMFPAKLSHCVYPFRTSDEYRISVSGNFGFDLNTI